MKRSLIFATSALLMLTAACSSPATRISRHRDAFAEWPLAVQEKVKAGQIDLGFTPEQVRVALGNPARTFIRRDNDGASEVWAYRGREPRFSVGFGVGVGGGSSGVGGGVAVGTGGRLRESDDAMRIVFNGGTVAAIETAAK